MNIFLKFGAIASMILFSSCGAYFNQPFSQHPSRTGEFSYSTQKLLSLPEAAQPLEVAVYNFSDQTGQYKPVENGSTFSTAVTQGGTTILIKALEDSGWFVPLERENFNNLSTERNIIRSTKQEYIKNLNQDEPPLPPLLYAGLLLEGGIISYDTNIITGGAGARYFGLGASARYRQDRITVYLRAISTNSGEILKTIYVSKTILSQSIDASLFRFVKFQRLLEVESGITRNEPVQIAVKDAIEKAVRDLILEGIIEGYWSAKDGPVVNQQLADSYLEEKQYDEALQLYDRELHTNNYKNHLSASTGGTLFNSDYATKQVGFLSRLEYQHNFSKRFGVNVSASILELSNGKQFNNLFGPMSLNAHYTLLPYDRFSPYIYGGPGLVREINDTEDGYKLGKTYFKYQVGTGLHYYVSNRIGIKAYGEYNISNSDTLDGEINGKRDDQYLIIGVGLNYNFDLRFSSKERRKRIKEKNNQEEIKEELKEETIIQQ